MKINTYRKFLELLEECVDIGYRFQTVPVNRSSAFPIYWKSPSTSLWYPGSIVHWVHVRKERGPMLEEEFALAQLELPKKKAYLIRCACHDWEDCPPLLRAALLKAVGLETAE